LYRFIVNKHEVHLILGTAMRCDVTDYNFEHRCVEAGSASTGCML